MGVVEGQLIEDIVKLVEEVMCQLIEGHGRLVENGLSID